MSEDDREAQSENLVIAGQERIEVPGILPVLPVRDVVIFPGVTVPLSIGRAKSLAALERAGQGGFLIVATQRDPMVEEPPVEELYPVGCVVRVLRVIDARREGKQAIVVGVARTRLGRAIEEEPAILMRLQPLPDDTPEPDTLDAARRRVVALAQRVIDLHDDYPDDWKAFVPTMPPSTRNSWMGIPESRSMASRTSRV